mmetsp:Transcript_12887/g.27365  ORF Transcript_12887/g.27365 Transcript_12887/m.27365 type:complete len:150 (+) Transcript_12887:1188-1637(+)
MVASGEDGVFDVDVNVDMDEDLNANHSSYPAKGSRLKSSSLNLTRSIFSKYRTVCQAPRPNVRRQREGKKMDPPVWIKLFPPELALLPPPLAAVATVVEGVAAEVADVDENDEGDEEKDLAGCLIRFLDADEVILTSCVLTSRVQTRRL